MTKKTMTSNYQTQTLNEFIIQQQNAFPYANGELTSGRTQIGLAGTIYLF